MTAGKKILLALGPHRSGTSVVTNAFHKANFAVGDDLLPSNEGNPDGYWEDQKFVALNESILKCLGRSWRDPRPIDARALTETPELIDHRKAIRSRLLHMLKDNNKVVIKDPRLCRTLPLWLDIIEDFDDTEVGCIVIHRQPIKAIQSLVRRDGENPKWAAALWLIYALDAVDFARATGLSHIDYETFLLHPYKSVEAALQSLGWHKEAAEAMEFRPLVDGVVRLDSGQQVQDAPPSSLGGDQIALHSWLSSAHEARHDEEKMIEIKTRYKDAFAIFEYFVSDTVEKATMSVDASRNLKEIAAELENQLKVDEKKLRIAEIRHRLKELNS